MRFTALCMAVYFLIGACIPRCDFSQLMHIDDLVDHYQLHVVEAETAGGSITVSEFLYIHFISGEEHDHESPADHDQLPMQQFAQTMTMHTASLDFHMGSSETTIVLDNIFPGTTTFISVEDSKGIFHPPIA